MIGSFSVVANEQAKREVALLIASIRQFYSVPVYVLCDSKTAKYLDKLNLLNVHTKTDLNKEKLEEAEVATEKVEKHNEFHSAPIILKKMDCIEWALKEAGDTLFLDADIVLVKPVHEDIDHSLELYLSPHFHVEETVKNNVTYGSMNAGYLWTNSLDLPMLWRDIYLTRSKFFEQEGMVHLLERFDTGLFDKSHNVGFWRFMKMWANGRLYLKAPGIEWDKVKSFHFHAFPETYQHANKGLTAGYDRMKELIWPKLPTNLKEFADALQ